MEIETHFKIEQMESTNDSGALAKLLCCFKKSKIKPRIRRDINLEQSIDNEIEFDVPKHSPNKLITPSKGILKKPLSRKLSVANK